MLRFVFCLSLCAALATALRAEVKPAPPFRDGAVLQRDKPVPVWGVAAPQEKVTVRFAGQMMETEAGSDGKWQVLLSPMAASATPQEMVISGANEVRINDVLIGDVWLGSGQSNMNWHVETAADYEKEKAAANHPLIRYYGVQNEVEDSPQTDTPGSWQAITPEMIGPASAVLYFFARELQPKVGVPIGIIKASPGGSGIESWLSDESLKNLPGYQEMMDRRKKALEEFPSKQAAYREALATWTKKFEEAKAAGQAFKDPKPRVPEGPKSRNAPAGLFNANVNPLVPYALRGIIWYQGEANASRHETYRLQLPALIQDWRRRFDGGSDLPFLIVQLANYDLPNDPSGKVWAYQRESQSSALTLPNTRMAVIVDVGEVKDIHPKNKQEVGRRLSLLARRHVYGEQIEADSPRAVEFIPVESGIKVKLDPSSKIELRADGPTGLEIAGEDRKFVPAEARIEADGLIVSSPAVPNPVAVRYLFSNAPAASLFTGEGLPVAPFRSDSW